MAEPFAKLVCSILSSSVWKETSDIRVVWITLLAMADKTGYVGASIDGIAHQARVSEEIAEEAMRRFQMPDPKSRSPEHEGRRVVQVKRGWKLLNYEDIRNEWQTEERKEQKRRWWREHRSSMSSSKSSCLLDRSDTDSDPDPDPEAEKREEKRSSAKADVLVVFECWKGEHGSSRHKLDARRDSRIRARLREGYTTEQLCQAIKNAKNDPFLMGENEHGRPYVQIKTLLRDAEQVDRLLALNQPVKRNGTIPVGHSDPYPLFQSDASLKPEERVDTAEISRLLSGVGRRVPA
jgi:hypothetical protein